MALSLTVTNAGSGPMARVVVAPAITQNLAFAACTVRVRNGTADVAGAGVRARTRFLINPGSTSSRDYQAAWRDQNGNWSEWSTPAKSLACANFSAGSTERSLASAAASDQEIEEPGVQLPEWTQGSGQSAEYSTLVTPRSFVDEMRRGKWPLPRTHFSVIFADLSGDEARLLHRLYRCANGPQKPMDVCFIDPATGLSRRFFCRFAEASLGADLQAYDSHSARYNLSEIPAEAEGETA